MISTAASVLCIGWGEAAKRFYAPAFQKLAGRGLELVVIERAGFPAVEPIAGAEPVTVWEDRTFARRMRAGEFEKIFILTPPQSHLEILAQCAERLMAVNRPCQIYLEKPISLDSALAARQLSDLLPRLTSAGHVVRLIDHYAAKRCVRWLKSRGQWALKKIAPINRMSFLSLERRPMPPSAVFEKGYAMEHGVHGWTIWVELFPQFLRPQTILKMPAGVSAAWRYRGAPDQCPAETGFYFVYDARLPELGPVEVRFAAAKAVGVDGKGILIEGANGSIHGSLSTDRIHLRTNDGAWHELDEGGTTSAKSAYEVILEGIFDAKTDSAGNVTIDADVGLWALKAIEQGVQSLPAPLIVEAGSLPAVLAREQARVLKQII